MAAPTITPATVRWPATRSSPASPAPIPARPRRRYIRSLCCGGLMGSDSVQHGRLSRADLMSLEQYSTTRKEFRGRVLEHKRNRLVAIGPNVTWAFEDRLTIQYQVQEMLRVERIFEAAGIQEELDAYNPLIPD